MSLTTVWQSQSQPLQQQQQQLPTIKMMEEPHSLFSEIPTTKKRKTKKPIITSTSISPTTCLETSKPKFKVMIVDDDSIQRKMIINSLRSIEMQIIEASNGMEAVQCYIETRPHLILMDISMPILDGFQATFEIRKLQDSHPVSATTKIIAVSSFCSDIDLEKGKHVGMDDWLVKPIRYKNLVCQVLEYRDSLGFHR